MTISRTGWPLVMRSVYGRSLLEESPLAAVEFPPGCGHGFAMETAGQTLAGVELGGTKCVCTLAHGSKIVDQCVIPTRSPDETLAGIESALDGWRGFDALGIASFGPVELRRSSAAYGRITTTTKPGWPGTDVAGRLARRFAVPTAFETDVNAAALAEIRWGAGRGFADFAYITVGTGVGAGLIVGGRPAGGYSHSELGHVRVQRLAGDDWPGACPYHGGCVEGLASGSALQARLGGRPLDQLTQSDPVWETVADALAQLCHVIVCAAAPWRIAIGGGVVSRQAHLLGEIETRLRASLAGYVQLPGPDPYLVSPALGDNAGPLGSIALALDLLDHS